MRWITGNYRYFEGVVNVAVDFAGSSRLILPIPPSVNHAYRNVAVHRRIKTGKAKVYIAEAGWMAKTWARKVGWTPPPLPIPVVMSIWIYWPDKRRRDPDNLLKILLDSLAGVLYFDDKVVWPQVCGVSVDRQRPRLEVEIRLVK